MTGTALPTTTVVAVIGAGTMGAGIALVAASAGHDVFLHDAQFGAAQRAIERLGGDLAGLVARGRITAAQRSERLARLHPAERLADLSSAGLVIEAIVENLDAKASVFCEIEALVSPFAILATNTSSLSVTALAAKLSRPDRLAGMHFFNPAPILPLVEIVSGLQTDARVSETLHATARAWGKTPVHCRSTPGFIVNRVARPFYGEGLRLLAEGVSDVATLDAIMRECGGFRMGPFELMDLIGHDVNYAVTASVYEAMYQDPRYKPSLIQKDLVDAGLLGRKSGRGFYDYANPAERPPPKEAAAMRAPPAIEVEGDLGVASPLVAMAQEHGIRVTRRDTRPGASPALVIDGIAVRMTAGMTATEQSRNDMRKTILFDLCRDYRTALRIAVALPAELTAEEASPAIGFFQTLGKSVSLVDDAPGLVVMRTLAMLVNEAADAVHQGVADVADVDVAMVKGVNYPSGPLAWADALGVGHLHQVMTGLHAYYGDDRYRVSPLLRRHALLRAPFHSRPEAGVDEF